MPEQGRVLKFPPRPSTEASSSYGCALATAQDYLSLASETRASRNGDTVYSNPDVLMALCSELRELLNVKPAEVGEEATRIYRWLSERSERVGYFDERDFFMGESALLAGGATRLVGDRTASELWLDRAEAAYRHTINPNASLARVAYFRLTLRYDMYRHREVLELLPSVALTFDKLGMLSELGKCMFLEALTLKMLGREADAVTRLETIATGDRFRDDSGLRGLAFLNLGDIWAEEGRFEDALASYRTALPLIAASNRPAALADLKLVVGETLRKMGRTGSAVSALRESVGDYLAIGMRARAAYIRVVLAEALLENGSPREAEWEILAALPTIDEQRMVPESFAALKMLEESVRSRKTDSKALSELRSYLQSNS